MNSGNGEVILNNSKKRTKDSVKAPPLADSVLRLIWQEHQISRAEIARQFSLSRSTVTEIVKELLPTGFVSEVGSGESTGGRRPIVLEFQDDARAVLGIDIGATHVAVALTDLRGRLLAWEEKVHPVRSDPEGTRSLVFELCDACLAARSYGSEKLLSIGVAVPSPVDPLHPEWISEVVVPAWQGRSELERLHDRYGVSVHVDNDANLGALAEHSWGAGKGVDDLIYIKIAHGIGAGYILNGKIYRGAGGVAGEMSHLPIDPQGKECVCGLKGCLSTFVSAPALADRVRSLINNYPESVLSGKQLAISDIEDAALSGDKLALHVVEEAAEYLGIAVSGWVNLMNPDMVIIGGSMARLDGLLLQPIQKQLQTCKLMNSVAGVRLRTGELGTRAVAIGAATFALKEAFDERNFYRSGYHTTSL